MNIIPTPKKIFPEMDVPGHSECFEKEKQPIVWEGFAWNIYQWKAMHPDSPYIESGYRGETTPQILGGQLHTWVDWIAKGRCGSVEAGVAKEFQNVLESLPFIAENTWNVEKISEFKDVKESVDEHNVRLQRMWGIKTI